MNKCPECNGTLEKMDKDFFMYGESVGRVETLVCNKCKAQFYEEQAQDKIDELAKAKGLWGLEGRTKLKKVGNSFAVTINKNIINFIQPSKDKEVLIYPENRHKLVIEI